MGDMSDAMARERNRSRPRRPDGSIDSWGYSDARGNPMTTLSDLMSSRSNEPLTVEEEDDLRRSRRRRGY
jgi:hypothetical protein